MYIFFKVALNKTKLQSRNFLRMYTTHNNYVTK